MVHHSVGGSFRCPVFLSFCFTRLTNTNGRSVQPFAFSPQHVGKINSTLLAVAHGVSMLVSCPRLLSYHRSSGNKQVCSCHGTFANVWVDPPFGPFHSSAQMSPPRGAFPCALQRESPYKCDLRHYTWCVSFTGLITGYNCVILFDSVSWMKLHNGKVHDCFVDHCLRSTFSNVWHL